MCHRSYRAELLRTSALHAHPRLARLGPDLLADPPLIDEMVKRARLSGHAEREIGDVLLDQRVAAGIGNVYKSEVLFEVRVHPRTKVRELSDAQLTSLFETAARAHAPEPAHSPPHQRAAPPPRTAFQPAPLGLHARRQAMPGLRHSHRTVSAGRHGAEHVLLPALPVVGDLRIRGRGPAVTPAMLVCIRYFTRVPSGHMGGSMEQMSLGQLDEWGALHGGFGMTADSGYGLTLLADDGRYRYWEYPKRKSSTSSSCSRFSTPATRGRAASCTTSR